MGLIKALTGAVGSTMADQWKEFFYCEALPEDVLVTKGKKRVSSRSSNTRGSDNIITNGSGVAVADGQCMIIVEQGKVVDVCAEPGEFTYRSDTEPSLFTGSLGKGILDTFKTIGRRFTYGGDTGRDQRVYYFNTKELIDNKFGTPNPIPFRVVETPFTEGMPEYEKYFLMRQEQDGMYAYYGKRFARDVVIRPLWKDAAKDVDGSPVTESDYTSDRDTPIEVFAECVCTIEKEDFREYFDIYDNIDETRFNEIGLCTGILSRTADGRPDYKQVRQASCCHFTNDPLHMEKDMSIVYRWYSA